MIGTSERQRGKLYFLNVKDGKILRKDGLVVDEFDFVEGYLERIFQKERDFNGETLLYWYINLRDDKGDLYSLGLPYSSGVFKSIVLSLARCETLGLSPVRIETYLKDGHTKVIVSVGGKRLDWITKELPPVTEQRIGGRVVKDDSARMEYICSLVEAIKAKI